MNRSVRVCVLSREACQRVPGSAVRNSEDRCIGGPRAGETDVITYDRELIQDGHIQLSDKPGLGVEINKDVAMKHLMDGETWWG